MLERFFDELSIEYSVYLTLVRVPTGRGFTLWGGNYPGGEDRLLRADGKFVLSGRVRPLWLFANAAEQTFEKPGLARRFEGVTPPVGADPGVDVGGLGAVDFVAASRFLTRGEEGNPVGVVDCLDLLRDCWHQTRGEPAANGVDWRGMDRLTRALWGGEVDGFDREMVGAFHAGAGWFEANCSWTGERP